MGDDEAIKLVITLQTHSEKLRSLIIQKDKDLAKLVSTARSLELAKKEVHFLKNNTFHSNIHTIGADTISDHRRCNNHRRGKDFKKQTKKLIEICRYCGEKVLHAGLYKARDAICNLCSIKGHFGKVCESVDPQVKETKRETNRVSQQNFTKDQNKYPSTMVTIKINRQQQTMKVDSGTEPNIISARTHQELRSKPVLQPSEAKLKPYSSHTTYPGCTTHGVLPNRKTPHATRDEESFSTENIRPAARRPTIGRTAVQRTQHVIPTLEELR